MSLLTKSIRMTREDVISLKEIINHDPRIERGQSEALFYAFKDAAEQIPDWNIVATEKFEGDKEIEIDPGEYNQVRTFNVEIKEFERVAESIKKQLNLSRPRVSYITRLCILAARKRINEKMSAEEVKEKKATQVEFETIRIDCMLLVKGILELLENINNSEEATQKVMKIKSILEE